MKMPFLKRWRMPPMRNPRKAREGEGLLRERSLALYFNHPKKSPQ
jgi:hypothetical protein